MLKKAVFAMGLLVTGFAAQAEQTPEEAVEQLERLSDEFSAELGAQWHLFQWVEDRLYKVSPASAEEIATSELALKVQLLTAKTDSQSELAVGYGKAVSEMDEYLTCLEEVAFTGAPLECTMPEGLSKAGLLAKIEKANRAYQEAEAEIATLAARLEIMQARIARLKEKQSEQ